MPNVFKLLADNVGYLKTRDRLDSNPRQSSNHDEEGTSDVSNGSRTAPAKFWLSLSEDLVYFMRWGIKFEVLPFESTSTGSTSDTSLNITINDHTITHPATPHATVNEIETHTSNITPNPHGHSIAAGVFYTAPSIENFKVFLAGYDITAYLEAQYPLNFPNVGNGWAAGLYPNTILRDKFSLTNAIDAAGLPTQLFDGDNLVPLEFTSNPSNPADPGIFRIRIYKYIQYPEVGR